jgi:hypothetical protein
VLAFVCARNAEPREKEVGDWMLLVATNPYTFWLPIVLWPFWLLLLCIPYSTINQEAPAALPSEIPISSAGTVIVPLAPVGRVVIAGVHRDARAEFGTLPKGASIVVIGYGVGSELIVQRANKAPEPTPGSVTPRATERNSK